MHVPIRGLVDPPSRMMDFQDALEDACTAAAAIGLKCAAALEYLPSVSMAAQ